MKEMSTMLLNSTYCMHCKKFLSQTYGQSDVSPHSIHYRLNFSAKNDFIGCSVNIQYRSSHLQPGHCDRLINNFLTISMNHYENKHFRKIASKSLFKTMPYKDMNILKSFCKMLTYSVLIFINCFYGNWCFLKWDIMYMTKFRVIK